jgi:hypothetical protein
MLPCGFDPQEILPATRHAPRKMIDAIPTTTMTPGSEMR